MGLFSGKKIISVASTVYNMAGEEKDRPQYLNSLIMRNVLSGTKDTIAQTINVGYTNSPALKIKQFFKWVTKKPERYDRIGIPNGVISTGDPLNPEDVAPYIPHAPGEEVWVQTASIGSADPTYWAEQWIFINRQADINTDWVCEYFRDSNTILIRFEDTSTVTIPATGFNYQATYLYAYYILVGTGSSGPIVPGSIINIGNDPFPDTSDWSLQSSTFTPVIATLTTKVTVKTDTLVEYSDDRPDESSSVTDPPDIDTSSTSYETGTRIYKKVLYYGGSDQLTGQNQWMNQWQNASVETDIDIDVGTPIITNEDIGGGVIKTTTVTVTTTTETDHVVYDRSYRIDTQNTVLKSYSDMYLMIYQIGSGNPWLDNLVNLVGTYDEFFPFIPFRLKGDWLSETNEPEAWAEAKKAYKKMTGSKLENLIDDLEDNEDLDDIDNGYIVFGVSLNVQEMACRRYIYQFLDKIQDTQIGGPLAYEVWKSRAAAQQEAMDEWQDWKDSQHHGGHDETGDDWNNEPPRPSYPELPKNEIRIKSNSSFDSQYDIRLQWSFITSGTGTGRAKPDAKSDDCWIEYLGEDEYSKIIYMNTEPNSNHDYSYEKFRIYWQRSSNTYSWLEVVGAKHRNYIYSGKDVSISAKEALSDSDESGFIIPLHYKTYWETSVIDRSQMATACVFCVFNSYTVTKQKWYETWIFRILLVIVIAIVSVVLTGGAGFGLLGAHMSIGTALGFSGMTAAIVGSVVNAMAALVISTLVEKAVVSLGAAGQIIGALFMMFLGNLAASFQNTGTLVINWNSFLRADNLIKMTDAVGKGVVGGIQADTASLARDAQKIAEKSKEETEKITQAALEEFGYNQVQVDVASLTSFSDSSRVLVEGSDTFLTRTLMTGSDIAELSQDMIENFPDYVNSLPTAMV